MNSERITAIFNFAARNSLARTISHDELVANIAIHCGSILGNTRSFWSWQPNRSDQSLPRLRDDTLYQLWRECLSLYREEYSDRSIDFQLIPTTDDPPYSSPEEFVNKVLNVSHSSIIGLPALSDLVRVNHYLGVDDYQLHLGIVVSITVERFRKDMAESLRAHGQTRYLTVDTSSNWDDTDVAFSVGSSLNLYEGDPFTSIYRALERAYQFTCKKQLVNL